MAGEIFYPPPAPVQPVPHAPIPRQGDQPPRRTIAGMMVCVLASWPTGFEYQAPQRAPTVPIPAQGQQPPRRSNVNADIIRRAWEPPDPQPQRAAVVVPIGTRGDQPPPYAGVVSDLYALVQSWTPPDPMPVQRPLTIAPLTLIYGDQPPKYAGILSDEIVSIRASDPPDPQPTQRRTTVRIPTRGDDPPRYSVGPMMALVGSWNPPDPMPYQRGPFAPIPPPIVNQPTPIGRAVLGVLIDSWRAPDPQPTQRAVTAPIPVQGDQPPRLRAPLPYSLWVIDPPTPQQLEQSAAIIPQVVSRVPFSRLPDSILSAWQVEPSPQPRRTTTPIPRQGQQPTPRQDYRRAVLDQWIEYPWPQQKIVRVPPPEVPPLTAFPAVIDAPPRNLFFDSPTRSLNFDSPDRDVLVRAGARLLRFNAPPRALDFDAPSDRGDR